MGKSKNLILAINPGATSTKLAVFNQEKIMFKKTIEHPSEDLEKFIRVWDQFEYRLDLIIKVLKEELIELTSFQGVVGRGGLLKPLVGGTYEVNGKMLADLKEAKQGEHASNLGAVLANELARKLNIPSFIVDPVSVDEMEAVARISGLPELERLSLSHALNMKAVAHKVAKDLNKEYSELNLILAHLGTGVSVSPHKKGRMIDVNNAREEGPFSPDRCGGLPVNQLINLCYSGKYTYEEMKEKLANKGGIYAYLKTTDLREVEKMAYEGNEKASLVLAALSYQIAKEIGAMATVLAGEVDRIILTGGMAYSRRIVNDIIKRVKFIAPVIVLPGEEELEALALGALRVLNGEEQAKKYI